jgi:hypothetical protein
MTIRTTLLLLAAVALVACEPPEGPNNSKGSAPASPGAAPAAAPAAATSPRVLSADARAAMKDKLAAEGQKKAWILSQPGNAEVAGLVTSLTGVFKDAGWDVQSDTVTGISLKPGLMTLVGDEQYPPYVDSVLKALDSSGLDAKSASGYRSYYESKKKENPSWPGVPIKPDQDFVIVVGPKPVG